VIISDVCEKEIEGELELSATVAYETEPVETCRFWMRRPLAYGTLEAPGDPLLVAFLLPCMALRENLRIHAAVTDELLSSVRSNLIPTSLEWHPDFSEVEITADKTVSASEARTQDQVGAFFSGGVDSWHSMIGNLDRVTHLIHMRGFEIEHDNEALWAFAHNHVQEGAKQFGKTVIPVSSNMTNIGELKTRERLRAVGRPYEEFGVKVYSGCMLVSMALLLANRMKLGIVPSSWTLDVEPPLGSHPLIEPKLSTSLCAFSLDGCDASRIEKIRFLKEKAPESLRGLRVCIDNSPENAQKINCGECIKCVRTLLELRACKAMSLCESFDKPPDLAALKRKQLLWGTLEFWDDIRKAAREEGDTELADTVSIILGDKFYFPRAFRAWSRSRKRAWKDLRRRLGLRSR